MHVLYKQSNESYVNYTFKTGRLWNHKKEVYILNSQETDYGIALIKPITGCCEINVTNKQVCLRDQPRVTTEQQEQETVAKASDVQYRFHVLTKSFAFRGSDST